MERSNAAITSSRVNHAACSSSWSSKSTRATEPSAFRGASSVAWATHPIISCGLMGLSGHGCDKMYLHTNQHVTTHKPWSRVWTHCGANALHVARVQVNTCFFSHLPCHRLFNRLCNLHQHDLQGVSLRIRYGTRQAHTPR